jgi:hypothetical protein
MADKPTFHINNSAPSTKAEYDEYCRKVTEGQEKLFAKLNQNEMSNRSHEVEQSRK